MRNKALRASCAIAAVLLTSAVPLAARPMTADDLVTLKRLSGATVAPDGRHVVYQVAETDLDANKRTPGLWQIDLAAPLAAAQRIGDEAGQGEHDAAFGPDGALYYLTGRSGSEQIWRVAPGGVPAQVSDLDADVGGFRISPDGRRIVVWGDIARDCPTFGGCKTDGNTSLPGPGTGRLYEGHVGFVRHWDQWETPGNYSRAFVFDLSGGVVGGKGVPLDGGVSGDSPGKPFGGAEEIAWGQDGRTVYFALRKADAMEPRSTNLDIYATPVATGRARNLTAANAATDTLPAVSPDGRTLAYVAMKRPGFEADRQVLMLRDLKSGKVRALTEAWDRSVASVSWAPDGRSIYVTAQDTLDEPLFRVAVADGRVERLTGAGTVSSVVPLTDGGVLFTMNSLAAPDDLYRRDAKGRVSQLTQVNRDALAAIDPVTVDRFSFPGAGGDTVWGIIVKPTGPAARQAARDTAKGKLPVAFVVHGGPQGSFGDGWSFRWNPKVMASQGYGVVSVDFHGSTGYGQAFTDSISTDWGGKPLEDLKLGLAAALAKDGTLDGDNACALGASYGGYMMNWIAGQWPDRFKCLVQHDGVFDARAMAYETEELWFDEWEHGGKAYFEDPAAYEKWNPVNHVAAWQTPMLVITSEKDFRIPYTQGLASFTALQRRGIPSRLLVFPDENHWVLKPKNSLQWHATVFDWLDRWTRRGGKAD